MASTALELGPLAWFAGWLVAVAALIWIGFRAPLQTRFGGWRSVAFHFAVVLAAVAVAALANAALTLHDLHIDLTRERIYTPSERDRKSTRLNSSHVAISYAVFCLKK